MQPRLHGCNLVARFRRSKTVVIVQDTEEGDVFLLRWKRINEHEVAS